MDSRNVVGIGNIYACEALFAAGISPKRRAGGIALERYERLVLAIKDVLRHAIRSGGTTLRDYVSSDGSPGFFERELRVYGKAGMACPHCKKPIKQVRQGQRSTFYCPHCQH
jgi:formamidopyrimidine-DNA glycosylase